MNPEELSAQLAEEEAKRDRHIDPAERWRQMQAMITWIDSQRPIPRNSKAGCLAEQRRLDAEFAKQRAGTENP